MSKKTDLKLARKVNWLYSRLNKKEFNILMEWVSANCDTSKEQGKEEARKELWKAVVEYAQALGDKIPFGLLISHGYKINDRKEWKKLKLAFKEGK